MLFRSHRRGLGRARGFTLAELMITVAIIGVLGSLAVVSYRKYFDSARNSEPIATLQAIRTSEEQVRRETGRYFNASASNQYYPMNSGFGTKRVPWGVGAVAQAHPDFAAWQMLEVAVDGPMRFGYKANAGLAGQPVAVPIEYASPPAPPASPLTDWFVLQAKGDPDDNGKPTVFLAYSFTGATETLFFRENQ